MTTTDAPTSPTPPSAGDGPTLTCGKLDGGEGLRFEIGGRLETWRIHQIWKRGAQALQRGKPGKLVVDASAVTYCDSTGATMLKDFREHQQGRGAEFEMAGFPEEFTPVLRLLERYRAEPEPSPTRVGVVEHVGRSACIITRDLGDLVGVIGEIVVAFAHSLRNPRRIRWSEVAWVAQTAGVNTLPVLVLVTGLLGLIMGFQAAQTLSGYGGEIFLANLIGFSFVRELGPLMTAIVLTARSGSAFAAEIGTMKINEEVDALETMGVNSKDHWFS